MFSNFDYTLSKHEETVRRAEKQYALLAGPRPAERTAEPSRPRRGLWAILRRIAGTPAAA